MSVQQYIRKASLLVGDAGGQALDLSELRFHFVIQRGDLQTPNSARVRVYNVSRQTDQLLRSPQEFGRVVIQAGYAGNYGIIFNGTIKQVRSGRESTTETYLDITAADGDSAYNFAVVAVSLAAGSVLDDHVNAVLPSLAAKGVTKGYVPSFASNPLPRGKIIFGDTKEALRNIARNAQTTWSIQDGQLQMVPITAYMPGDIAVINSQTGMIGLPEQIQNGIKVRVLLNPNIKIGSAIQIDEASIQRLELGVGINQQVQNQIALNQARIDRDGIYKVLVAEHTGDTRGEDWYTEILAIAIDASVSTQDLLNKNAVAAPFGSVKPYG